MRPYERPALTKAGSFKKITGLGGSGPKDTLGRHQSPLTDGPTRLHTGPTRVAARGRHPRSRSPPEVP